MNTDCIFCKIAAGEIPVDTIYENEETLAFLDIRPVNHGHTLVIPKKHYRNVFDTPKETWGAVMETVRMLSPFVKEALEANGITIKVNNEPASGQTAFHTHVHIIPRFDDDGHMNWPQNPYSDDESAKIAQKIKDRIA